MHSVYMIVDRFIIYVICIVISYISYVCIYFIFLDTMFLLNYLIHNFNSKLNSQLGFYTKTRLPSVNEEFLIYDYVL